MLIGLDVGTSGVKGVAIEDDGAVAAVAEESYPLSTPQPGWAEQDPEAWWRASQRVLAQLPEGPIGLSGQMHGLVVLGEHDEVLRPAILWNDMRSDKECAELTERAPELHRIAGNLAMPGFTAPKLLWVA
ncbi:MAG: FGGY family carbohydrate kinase, partial [Gaiellaceae bacterium]